ncbi:MAG: ArsC family reductase [Methylococcales bacterium]
MPMTTLFGIKNCDTVRKARKWLKEHEVDYKFHDFRADGLDVSLLDQLESELGWENMINRRGTTWRQLSEAEQSDLTKDKAKQLMLEQPTLIKRPIFESKSRFLLGFSSDDYQKIL